MAKVPVKLAIMRRLTALLEEIKPVEGVHSFDLEGRVYRGASIFGEESEDLMVALIESPNLDPGIHAGAGQARSESWRLLLQGRTTAEAQTMQEALDQVSNSDKTYLLAAVVQEHLGRLTETDARRQGRSVYPEHYHFGYDSRVVADVRVSPYVVRPASADTNDIPVFYTALDVTLAHKVSEPFIDE